MSLLQCWHCGRDMSATHKACPYCGRKISFWRDTKKFIEQSSPSSLKNSIEQSRLRQAFLAVVVLFLLGTTWYLRMSSGVRWPLYATVVASAPIMVWLLQLAYKNAIPEEESETEKAKDAEESPDQKIWRG